MNVVQQLTMAHARLRYEKFRSTVPGKALLNAWDAVTDKCFFVENSCHFLDALLQESAVDTFMRV